VTVAVGVYYPVVTTALKVLACHTSYQCVFDGGCWAAPSASFVAAAYLAALVLLVYGLAFPLCVFAVLARRQSVLRRIFLGSAYAGTYTDDGDADEDASAADTADASCVASRIASVLRGLLRRRAETVPDPTPDAIAPAAGSGPAATPADASSSSAPPPATDDAAVSPNEYARFQETDQSVLSQLYADAKFAALSFTTVAQFGRVLLIVPPVVADSGSLAQMACIVAGEVFFFALVVLRDPFVSLWLKIIHLLGAVHQLVIVSLQTYVLAVSHERDISAAAGSAMAAVTTMYVAVVVAIIAVMVLGEFFETHRNKAALRDVLARVRFTSLQDSPLLLLPAVDGPLALQPIAVDDDDDVAAAEFSDLGGSEVDDHFAFSMSPAKASVRRPTMKDSSSGSSSASDGDSVITTELHRSLKKRRQQQTERILQVPDASVPVPPSPSTNAGDDDDVEPVLSPDGETAEPAGISSTSAIVTIAAPTSAQQRHGAMPTPSPWERHKQRTAEYVRRRHLQLLAGGRPLK
jgi:hypothetical protein